jgi:hypothetical protein
MVAGRMVAGCRSGAAATGGVSGSADGGTASATAEP